MTFKEIQELIKLINKTNLTEFKVKDKDFELTIRTKDYHKARQSPKQVVSPSIMPVAPQAVQPVPAAQATAQSPPTPTSPPQTEAPKEQAGAADKNESDSNYVEIKSPMVGTFYRSPSPEKPPYLQVGDSVQKGDTVCIIEAMKLFNEIESEVSGKVVKVLVEDAQPVEYDQPLFLVEPS